MFKKFDYYGGRTFVVGDIHGEFDLLIDELEKVDFNTDEDTLFSVGDLVDRGPKSIEALYYLRQPWFKAVRGNHEQMTIDAGGRFCHVQNGGGWYNELDENTQNKVKAAFRALPYIIEFDSPSGRSIGVVHAGFYPRKWENLEKIIEEAKPRFDGENHLLWDRSQIYGAKDSRVADEEFIVEGIDHIYFGHTPLKQPLTRGNMTWLDTGAFATGNLTIVEVE